MEIVQVEAEWDSVDMEQESNDIVILAISCPFSMDRQLLWLSHEFRFLPDT